MATNMPTIVTFDKMAHFDNVARFIYQTYDPLIDQLIARRDALLQMVHELREDHRNKETNRIAAIEELERVQQQMQEIRIKENPILKLHQEATQVYQQGMKEMEPSTTFLCPVFRCQNKDTIRQLISELGEIVQCEIPDYSLKREPVLTVGKLGGGANELFAAGIAFDESTELMYIADYWNSRVQIVSLKGEFVTQFGNDKLRCPWGITVNKESIFVTDVRHDAILQFLKKDFNLINRTATEGNKEGELNCPHGLCIDTNGDVLVADCDNNRVAVFSKHLKFKSCIGIGQLCHPTDVKLSADRVVVLDRSPKCVHFFSREGHPLSSCVSKGTGDIMVANPNFFCVDSAGNIIISDRDSNAIKIYTESGQLILTLGREGNGRGEFIVPYGVCISKLGIICVVSENSSYSLQCF